MSKIDDRTPSSADENKADKVAEKIQDVAVEKVAKSGVFGTVKELIDRYTHCVICDSNLHFIHVTDFSRNLTQEAARCPECGVKTQSVTHRLQ